MRELGFALLFRGRHEKEMRMPVSKKRKKSGKPVHRRLATTPEGEEHAHGPEVVESPLQKRLGKPTNPYVTAQPRARASQLGR
jgi:hypothetical protein